MLENKVENYNEKEALLDEIISVYENEIPNIQSGLDMYEYYQEGKSTDYSGDMDKVKAKLLNYKDNLELEEHNREYQKELAKLQQENINLSANANNSNNINIQITLEQVTDVIQKIPDDIMSKEEKEDLKDKVSGIEATVKSGKKDKAKEKIVSILRFLADKGADALIAMLPYLGQMARLIQ